MPFKLRFSAAWIRCVVVCAPVLSLTALIATLIVAQSSTCDADESGAKVEFNRDIRPLLSDKCFACHGPDKNKREADLRLDTREGLFHQAGSAANVVPGDPARSRVWQRATSSDPTERMPPPDSGKELSPHELALLRAWIEQGAPWEGHWAFQPIQRPEPSVAAASSNSPIYNPIDRFIQAELATHGLKPAAAADPVTLVRRLSFDLRGLPPSPLEVDQFIADKSPDAYERLVDRWLQSPHYGERMAQWWLDLVRYADSVGYHGDQPVSVHPFREYVIRSFERNKPFDQFTIEQLAGDLLPDPTLEQRIASGYNRLGMMSAEGGVQDKEYLAKYIAERVRNVGAAWLGITLGCCECHDHKYDPLPARDFYQLEAFFADIQERGLYSGAHATGEWGPTIRVPTEEQSRRLSELDALRSSLQSALNAETPELAAAQAEWEKSQIHWSPLLPSALASQHEVRLAAQTDGSIVASGPSPATDVYTATIPALPTPLTAIRLEVLPDDSLPKKGPGRAGNGNFVLTEFVVRVAAADGTSRQIELRNATATYEQTGAADKNPYGKWSAASAIDGDAKGAGWGWAVMEQVGRPQSIVFEIIDDLRLAPKDQLVVEIRQLHENPQHTIGRFRLFATNHARPVRADSLSPPAIATILAIPSDKRNDSQRSEAAAYYRSITPLLAEMRRRLDEANAQHAALLKLVPTTLTTVAVSPRTIRVLPRGNWMDDSGEIVSPAFPATLPHNAAMREGRLTRLDLARWLASPENPLTARNVANRIWKLFFGAGLSRKLDDLGAQGEWPTHPLLLDWLASQFIDSGWDVRRLVKTIVMSHAYRQSSLESPQMRERDPFNRLLARQSRWRLDAEFVRDNALSVSGLLVDKQGGPSVFPYQPPGYWAHLNFPQREWKNSTGDELYRRGLYTHWQRQYLHPSLSAFDAPSREECAADRPRSNTPLQSLVLLNDAAYVEAARALAERALAEGGSTTAERVAYLFRRTLTRTPSDREQAVLESLYAKHVAEYRLDGTAAEMLLKVGAKPTPPGVDRAELAAWTSIARVLLNLHEFVTRS
ncbi:MAG: PSD1 and planctomycete cytochrome C domain-containing protein [Pirellulales bacterium]